MKLCPVLIGRNEEIETLTDLLALGGCALVGGEAGIGKSRLLREFATIVSARGRRTVWGRPESIARPGPYSLVFDLLDWIGTEKHQASDEARELSGGLERLLEQPEPPARQVAARMRGLLCETPPPAVALIEDLHLADELSLAVLAHLIRAAAEDGFLVVGSYRTETESSSAFERFLDVVLRERLATAIELGPMERQDLRRMLVAMWERAPSDEELQRLEEQAEGVPFFIEELASSPTDTLATIPASISRAVVGRLHSMTEASQQAARMASLLGRTVDAAALSEVMRQEQGTLVSHLRDAIRAGILSDEGGRIAFRHSLVRQAIEETVSHLERVEAHARIAQVLVRRREAGMEASAEEIGDHLFAAGQGGSAGDYWLAAAERALSVGAVEEARRLFTGVLENPHAQHQDARAIYGMGIVLYRSGDIDAATHWLRQASAMYQKEGQPEEAAKTLWRLASFKALLAPAEACEVLDEALALVDSGPVTETFSRLIVRKGYILVRLAQDIEGGRPLLEQGLRDAERLQHVLLQAEAHEALAWVAEDLGDQAAADTHGAAANSLVLTASDPEALFRLQASEATRMAFKGRCDEALRVLDRTSDEALPGFGALHVAAASHLRAWIHWLRGQPMEADRFAARVETTKFAGIYGRIIRIWAAMERGEEWLARAIVGGWWEELGGPEFRRYSLREASELPDAATQVALGELILHSMLVEPADEEIFEMADRFERTCRGGRPDNVGLAATLRSRLLLIADKLDQAEAALNVFEHDLRTQNHPLRFAAALEMRSLIRVGRDDFGQGARVLARAVELLREASNSSDLARCLRLWAKINLAAGGGKDASIEALKEAREIALSVGALVQLNMSEAALRSLGVRPRAGRPKGSGTPEGMLSAREEEIAVLIAGGATNAEIARRLFLSVKTVENHLSRAQKRLGVGGRAGLAAWAAKQGLV